jgi:hypothetical protein
MDEAINFFRGVVAVGAQTDAAGAAANDDFGGFEAAANGVGIFDVEVAMNETVPVCAVNVPELSQNPRTETVFAPPALSVFPEAMLILVAFTEEPSVIVFEVPFIATLPRSCFAAVLSVQDFDTEPENVVVALPFWKVPEAPIERSPWNVSACDPGVTVPKFMLTVPVAMNEEPNDHVPVFPDSPNVTLENVEVAAPVESMDWVVDVALNVTVPEPGVKPPRFLHDPPTFIELALRYVSPANRKSYVVMVFAEVVPGWKTFPEGTYMPAS